VDLSQVQVRVLLEHSLGPVSLLEEVDDIEDAHPGMVDRGTASADSWDLRDMGVHNTPGVARTSDPSRTPSSIILPEFYWLRISTRAALGSVELERPQVPWGVSFHSNENPSRPKRYCFGFQPTGFAMWRSSGAG